ncbi:hypothetical protein KIL84_006962 [Mauremys mutica]|uniref:Uncharacterized protein n=1 Tax=Mauremys mutica TaxID=74926 RepID=A0A9D4AV35_9SAUR|nr:hypothetical protein KIL84_006962 [Mauremys mutica]
MSDAGGGGPGGGGEEGGLEVPGSAVQNVADVSVLQKHLRKLVPLLLEDGGEVPAALEAALEEKGALEQMRKFLSDPQVHTVLVERSTLKDMISNLDERWVQMSSCMSRCEVDGVERDGLIGLLAFIKRTPVIDADKQVSSQLLNSQHVCGKETVRSVSLAEFTKRCDFMQVTAVAQQNQGDVPEPQDMKVAEVLFDAADANAIEEVNLAYENVEEVDGLDVTK